MFKNISRIVRPTFKTARRFYWIVGLLILLGVSLYQARIALALSITEFPVPTPGGLSIGLTTGPDGNLWFTELVSNQIGRITPTGIVTEFPIPSAISSPGEITTGPDGNLWFTEQNGNKIGRITPAGSVTEFPLPEPQRQPSDIITGPDGNLWFTEQDVGQIGRITPLGFVTEFPLPNSLSAPTSITVGPDDNLWFTEIAANKIGRITPTGIITEFSIPTPITNPVEIVTGPDGNLWFAQANTNQIGRMTLTGVVTEFSVPTKSSIPQFITVGPDGNLWFTESGGNKVGYITTSGTITEFPTPTGGSQPLNITSGPDGNVWFVEELTNKIGRINLDKLLTLNLTFAPSQIPINGTTSMTFNLANPGTITLTTVSFSDNLPANLTIAAGGITANTCTGSTIGGANKGSGILTFIMPSLAINGRCSFTVEVTSATPGSYTNTVTSISSAETGKQPINASATLIVGANKGRANPADLIAQLRVTPDRLASLDPSNEISYTLSVKNIGPGKANNVSLRFPIDANLVAGYTNFSNPKMWVSAIVTNVAQPYLQISLPSLEPHSKPLTGTIVFRPSANAQTGAIIFTRYSAGWDDDTGGGKTQLSNAVRFVLGKANQNVSGGAIQLFDPPNATVQAGNTFKLSGDFYIPNELVTFWYTDKNGTSIPLGTKRADATGKLNFELDLKDFKAEEVYAVAGFGNRSEVTGSTVLTIVS
jgi:uncharacterized repeat protein (TIGR01451 family)